MNVVSPYLFALITLEWFFASDYHVGSVAQGSIWWSTRIVYDLLRISSWIQDSN
jgi:hypothetical protein